MGTDKRSLARDAAALKLSNVSVLGDWDEKTQCFYYTCGRSSSSSTTSDFASDLCAYLSEYRLPDISFWIDRLRNCDFSAVTDRLVFSVPGYHQFDRMNKFGHVSLARLLRNRPPPDPEARHLLVAQCSSIGSLGEKKEAWLYSQFLQSLLGGKTSQSARLFLVYPCVEDVRDTFELKEMGVSRILSIFCFQESTAKRQPWLREYMCKWRSESRGRSKAMPHVKVSSSNFCSFFELWERCNVKKCY
ncbi:unnamed protein product [Nippostrongylus brasiliensis]|uniref:Probable tyrosyl-DNA phosphodiesterase (inferred by orthology to a C. elegans protein) n=1 Tax=Nippostrongylus brasiliensis TaxID=27835 RepID=A0A0N4YJU9_NIPBR|nr:unnamed protein product [Nippostrongylus brasiliensis]